MPLARIIGPDSEPAYRLQENLRQRGFAVEMPAPGASASQPADLEVEIETCAVEEALARAEAFVHNVPQAQVFVASGVLPAAIPPVQPAPETAIVGDPTQAALPPPAGRMEAHRREQPLLEREPEMMRDNGEAEAVIVAAPLKEVLEPIPAAPPDLSQVESLGSGTTASQGVPSEREGNSPAENVPLASEADPGTSAPEHPAPPEPVPATVVAPQNVIGTVSLPTYLEHAPVPASAPAPRPSLATARTHSHWREWCIALAAAGGFAALLWGLWLLVLNPQPAAPLGDRGLQPSTIQQDLPFGPVRIINSPNSPSPPPASRYGNGPAAPKPPAVSKSKRWKMQPHRAPGATP